MKVSVLGTGRWGSFLAWYLDRLGHEILLYGREGSKSFAELEATRNNGVITLSPSITLTHDLQRCAKESEVLLLSISSQALREFMEKLSAYPLSDRILVLCMKGLEEGTGKRLSQIVSEYTPAPTAIWVGPGHVQYFVHNIPNCMVIDSADYSVKHTLIEAFSGNLIRFYYGNDLLGNEIGAAAKNVIGIAAGMLDGFGYSSLKGALMARGPREVAKLIGAMGGNEMSAYGLAHLGDFEATVFSPYSRNRLYGERFIQGKPMEKLAEGVSTTKAMMLLGEKYGVELPICHAIYQAIYEKREPRELLSGLFLRDLKREF